VTRQIPLRLLHTVAEHVSNAKPSEDELCALALGTGIAGVDEVRRVDSDPVCSVAYTVTLSD
jgi:hypothetical protein